MYSFSYSYFRIRVREIGAESENGEAARVNIDKGARRHASEPVRQRLEAQPLRRRRLLLGCRTARMNTHLKCRGVMYSSSAHLTIECKTPIELCSIEWNTRVSNTICAIRCAANDSVSEHVSNTRSKSTRVHNK